jgi:uncharacterized protein YjbI with pentapeptide repeats
MQITSLTTTPKSLAEQPKFASLPDWSALDALKNTGADVWDKLKSTGGVFQEGAKWTTPLTTLYIFFNREDVTNGADRLIARDKFDRRTTQTLQDDKTSNNDLLKILHYRDRWGLNALPKESESIPERESAIRLDETDDPAPVAYEKYNPEKPSLIAGKNVRGLKIPVPIALPNIWRGKANQWRIPLDASGTPNSKLNHDYAIITDGKLLKSNFSNSTLRHVDASNTNMTGSDLTDTELLKTGLFKTLLSKVRFIRTKGIPSSDPQFWADNLKGAEFEGDSAQNPMALTFQNFAQKQMDGARLKWVDWFKSSLKGGSLAKGKLEAGVRILGMAMQNADLTQLEAPNQDWSGVNVKNAPMAGIKSPNSNFTAIENLNTANLDSTAKHPGDLSNSDFRGQNLFQRKLRHINFTNSIFSPVGEPVAQGRRPYRFKQIKVTDYLKPIMLSPAESRLSDKGLIKRIKRTIDPVGKKLVSLAYMEKPYETKACLAANNEEAYKALITLAKAKQHHYEVVRKAKAQEHVQLLKLWEQKKAANALKHANTAGAWFSHSNMTGANLQGNDLTKSQFVGSNLKNTLLKDANVTETNFTKGKNLTTSQLLQAKNAQGLVINPGQLQQLVQKLQHKRRVSKNDTEAAFPTRYLSPKNRLPLLNAISTPVLVQKALLETVPNAFIKTYQGE